MTREEAIEILKQRECCRECVVDIGDCNDCDKAFEMAFKAIEQEPILDKIRAEIEKAVWEDVIVSLDGTDETRIPRLEPDDVFRIIEKYKAEMRGGEE